MIGKKAPNPKKSSSKAIRVTALSAYITRPELANGREKCIHYEAQNFITDDLKSQTLEMVALSHSAVRSKDPIDHYVLSWQEGEQPSIAQARQAVHITLKHLGLQGHQVIWGMHSDTDHVHIHIEVNRVHPQTFKVVEINKGFQNNAIQQAAAMVEKVQGWKTHASSRFRTDELGHLIRDSKNRPQVFDKPNQLDQPKAPTGPIKDKEIQTGEKSAQRLCIELAAPIIAASTSWKQLHEALANVGIEYRQEGSGAKLFINRIGVKASDVVERKNNFGALQRRLGPYQSPQQLEIKHDPFHRTRLVKDKRFKTGFDEPHAAAAGFTTFHTLHDLPGSHLDVAQNTKRKQHHTENLLQFDESLDHRRVERVRWGSHRDRADRGARERHPGEAGSQSAQLGERAIKENGEGASQGGQGEGQSGKGRGQSEGQREGQSRQRQGQGGQGPSQSRQPLTGHQPGWCEYTAIRDALKAAKTHATMELQQRHSDERAALLAKLKAQRTEALKKSGKDKGAERNALESLLALVQAAEKLELQARQRNEKKALQATYKPLPVYKEWKAQPQIVGLHVLPASEQRPVASTSPVASTLRFLTSTMDARQHTTYQLFRKDVFRDEGRMIVILDLNSDAGIAAALALGQAKFGNVLTLTGPPAFQHNAVALAVANGLTCRFADPALEVLRERLQAEKYQVEHHQASLRLEKATETVLTPSSQPAGQSMAPGRRAKPTKPVWVPTAVKEAVTSQAHENDQPAAQAEAAEVAEAHRLAQEEKAEQAEAEQLAEERRLAEGVQLADIHQQIDAAKAAADPSSKLALSTTTTDDHNTPAGGVVIASNDAFVAVQVNDKVKLYKTAELTKNLKYDGIDTGHGRFAPGNEIERKNGEDGMRTLLREVRNAMQTEETKQRVLAKSKSQGR
uniref:Conjugal transfer relaxase TraI n=1 Tax=Polaromonas sp. H8N TaxID=1840297 RepID=A0A2S1FJB4_9BURK|nr:relaxase/mobilization nuclease domain-containing protein [Polaromonas sp. H8N]AWD72286.1 conjugal transfer relaxase TraI [Polaromonas sp. H8N]